MYTSIPSIDSWEAIVCAVLDKNNEA